MREGYFTKKKLVMFIFFCIQFANIAFGLAIFPSIFRLDAQELSILLLLLLLYIDPYEMRRMTVPIILAFEMGYILWGYMINPQSILTLGGLFTACLVTGAFFFGKNMFTDSFDKYIDNIIITVGCGLYIGWVGYQYLPAFINIFSYMPLSAVFLLLGFLSIIVVPAALITYTWLRRFKID